MKKLLLLSATSTLLLLGCAANGPSNTISTYSLRTSEIGTARLKTLLPNGELERLERVVMGAFDTTGQQVPIIVKPTRLGFATNSKVIFIDPEFFKSMSNNAVMFALLHEIGHIENSDIEKIDESAGLFFKDEKTLRAIEMNADLFARRHMKKLGKDSCRAMIEIKNLKSELPVERVEFICRRGN